MKITKQAMTALEESIEHWERVVEGEKTGDIEPIGPQFCPLCLEFSPEWRDCRGCPIEQDTGQPYCRNTPYQDAGGYHGDNSNESVVYCQKELDYLEDLMDRCEVCDEADIS